MIFIVHHTLFELFTYFNFLFHSFKQYRVITGNVAAKKLERTIVRPKRVKLSLIKRFSTPDGSRDTGILIYYIIKLYVSVGARGARRGMSDLTPYKKALSSKYQ